MSLENNLAINKKEKHDMKKEYFLSNFDILINQYSDEITDNIIDGSMEKKDFKFRTNWFNGVITLLDYVSNLLPEEFNSKWINFLKSFKERREGLDDTRTTREEIEIATNLLFEAKKYIESKIE